MKQILITHFFHLLFIALLTAKFMNCNLSWLAVFQPIIIEISLVFGFLACQYGKK